MFGSPLSKSREVAMPMPFDRVTPAQLLQATVHSFTERHSWQAIAPSITSSRTPADAVKQRPMLRPLTRIAKNTTRERTPRPRP
jgi:hypothetical protein